jgi:hypothetical protein
MLHLGKHSPAIITCRRAGLSLLMHSNNTCKQNSWNSTSDLQIDGWLMLRG